MNPRYSKTSKHHIFIIRLTDKIDLRGKKSIALSNLSIYYT